MAFLPYSLFAGTLHVRATRTSLTIAMAPHAHSEFQPQSLRLRFFGILVAILIAIGIVSRKDPTAQRQQNSPQRQRGSYLILRHPTESSTGLRAPLLSIPHATPTSPPPTLRIPTIQAPRQQRTNDTASASPSTQNDAAINVNNPGLPTFRLRRRNK